MVLKVDIILTEPYIGLGVEYRFVQRERQLEIGKHLLILYPGKGQWNLAYACWPYLHWFTRKKSRSVDKTCLRTTLICSIFNYH